MGAFGKEEPVSWHRQKSKISRLYLGLGIGEEQTDEENRHLQVCNFLCTFPASVDDARWAFFPTQASPVGSYQLYIQMCC